MVYRPGKPRGPSHNPNEWNVYVKGWIDFSKNPKKVEADVKKLEKEVSALIKAEGREHDVKILGTTGVGSVKVQCDPAFGMKLGQLPTAESAQMTVYRYPAGKKPGGPRM